MMDTRDGDSRELAEFGYLQRLERPLGSVAAFAISYGFVAVFTAVTALFFFGFAASSTTATGWRSSRSSGGSRSG